MPTFPDQLGQTILLSYFPPKRIISLVPSQTELLADLGLDAEVVGITKFCVHPQKWFNEKKRVGGTKTVNMAVVAELAPDLIIGNKEENEQVQIEYLRGQYPVWMSDIDSVDDALAMIGAIGELTDRGEQAAALQQRITTGFAELPNWPAEKPPLRVAYIIWRKPFMVAGKDTFIHSMLRTAGFQNAFGETERYPQISPFALAQAAPDLILLSSEPYPFADKHFAEFQDICPGARIRLVDGEVFSWYGSRMQFAPDYLRALQEWSLFAHE